MRGSSRVSTSVRAAWTVRYEDFFVAGGVDAARRFRGFARAGGCGVRVSRAAVRLSMTS